MDDSIAAIRMEDVYDLDDIWHKSVRLEYAISRNESIADILRFSHCLMQKNKEEACPPPEDQELVFSAKCLSYPSLTNST